MLLNYSGVINQSHPKCTYINEHNEFLHEYIRKYMRVNRQVHRNYKANVQKNKDVVAPIVHTIKLYGGQNLPFRSHCVCVKEQSKVAKSGTNNRSEIETNRKHHLDPTPRIPGTHSHKYKTNLLLLPRTYHRKNCSSY